MELSRVIPSHKKTLHFEWVKHDFLEYTEHFRKIRSGSKNKMDRCFWCKTEFNDGEWMALAQIKELSKNKVFCRTCINEAEGSAVELARAATNTLGGQ